MNLELESYAPKLKNINKKLYIFDTIRKKYIRFTKEEWVRQCVLDYFINKEGYNKGFIRTEYEISNNKRVDIAFFNAEMNLEVLVECKAPDCEISVFSIDQIQGYNNILKAKKLILTNGVKSLIWERQGEDGYLLIDSYIK